MKLLNDAGEVIGEYPDSAALLVFTANDIHLVVENMPDDAEVPVHVIAASQTMVFIHDEHNVEEINRYFEMKAAGAH